MFVRVSVCLSVYVYFGRCLLVFVCKSVSVRVLVGYYVFLKNCVCVCVCMCV